MRHRAPRVRDDIWDDLIFSETRERWLKAARIIGRVSDRVPNGPHFFDAIAARLVACRFFRTLDQATAPVCGTCG
jgi:hypothetical protein